MPEKKLLMRTYNKNILTINNKLHKNDCNILPVVILLKKCRRRKSHSKNNQLRTSLAKQQLIIEHAQPAQIDIQRHM